MSGQSAATKRDIYSISRLNKEVSKLLGTSFPLIWVEGEISNFSQPRSGHMYFSLKDDTAQIRAAMFRNNNLYLRFQPESGMQVLVRARVALYEPRGDFQLIVEHMEEAGDGALQRAFEQLKQKLFQEGLFDQKNKRVLPEFPSQLGVITSPSGAAIKDVLSVLNRRYAGLPILIYPVAVQGESAPKEIVQALNLAQQRAECDILLLTRGGGSLEDLQAFNSEAVARAIADCPIPIVTGIGHEIDFTIADYIADQRAATPSAAAELISPSTQELQQRLLHLQSGMRHTLSFYIKNLVEATLALQTRLNRLHPQQQLNAQAQKLDELENRLHRSTRFTLQRANDKVTGTQIKLNAFAPIHRLRQLLSNTSQLTNNLLRSIKTLLHNKQQNLDTIQRSLDAVSPLNTLKRGYAVVTRVDSSAPLLSASSVDPGDRLNVRLSDGKIGVKVDKKNFS